MKISIIIAYYNRRALFIKTLESLLKSAYNNFEIIVIDDASIDSQRIDDLPKAFSALDLKVLRIEKYQKWWVNPCIPNNIGFGLASGDVFIIQNPECLHMGDIVIYTADHIALNRYLVFGCYALDNDKTRQILGVYGGESGVISSIIKPINDVPLDHCVSMNRWYQHSKYSDRCLNFCTAIMRKDLEDLGGFDEEYAEGISYDDTEFVTRIKKKGMLIDMVDNPFVIHQWHPYTDYSNKKLVQRNTELYFNKTVPNPEFRVNNFRTKAFMSELILF